MTHLMGAVVIHGARSTVMMADIRCNRCQKLLFRWAATGLAELSVKCPRCGNGEILTLSTG